VINREKLAEEIDQLYSSGLLLEVIAMIAEIQPEVLLMNNDEVRIMFTLLTEENVKKMSAFVKDLMKKAVKGEIDPFDYGSVVERQVMETEIV
jgi:hypothetical protein